MNNALIENNTIPRVWKKIDSLAEAKGMTRKEFIAWSEAEHNRSNISEYEHNLIQAYQTSKAIERLKINSKDIPVRDIEEKHSWIIRFKDGFNKVDEAIKHLKEVCSYVKEKEGIGYEYEWLLGYDDVLYERIIEGSKGKNKKSRFVRDD